MAVRAEIDFLAPGTERPFTYARETPSGAEPETARFVSHAVELRDLRGGEVLRLDGNAQLHFLHTAHVKSCWALAGHTAGSLVLMAGTVIWLCWRLSFLRIFGAPQLGCSLSPFSTSC